MTLSFWLLPIYNNENKLTFIFNKLGVSFMIAFHHYVLFILLLADKKEKNIYIFACYYGHPLLLVERTILLKSVYFIMRMFLGSCHIIDILQRSRNCYLNVCSKVKKSWKFCSQKCAFGISFLFNFGKVHTTVERTMADMCEASMHCREYWCPIRLRHIANTC